MEVLVCLAEHSGEVASKEKLLQTVWPDTFVSDDVLKRSVSELRRVFGDDAHESRIIETIPRRGYRLLVAVAPNPVPNPVPIPESPAGISRGWLGRAFKIAGALLLAALALLAIPRSRHWLMGRVSKQPVQSLAVLPFENLSGNSSKDYFADGFTDELITDLAEQTKIRVVSRSSVMRYKGSRKPLPEIARELGVDAIVEGSVSLSDQQVRITAKLIEASSDRHLWAHSYERDRKDLFSVQSEVAATIAGLIGTNGVRATTVLGRRFTPETYQLYLECRNLMQTGTEDGMHQAIDCYQQILKLDPNCASAYAGMSDATLTWGSSTIWRKLALPRSKPWSWIRPFQKPMSPSRGLGWMRKIWPEPRRRLGEPYRSILATPKPTSPTPCC